MNPRQYSTPYTGPEGPVSLSERQAICERVVGSVAWSKEGDWGYCMCPGGQNHTGKDGRRDCRVFADEKRGGGRGATLPPGVHCLHQSCAGAVEEASKRIRSEIGRAKVRNAPPSSPAPRGGKPEGVRGAGHTARTFKFGCAEKKGEAVEEKTTARTEGSRPLTRFAHVRTHAHCETGSGISASEPSTTVATPVALPAKTVAGTAVPVAKPDPLAPKPVPDDRPGIVTHIGKDGTLLRLNSKGDVAFEFKGGKT